MTGCAPIATNRKFANSDITTRSHSLSACARTVEPSAIRRNHVPMQKLDSETTGAVVTQEWPIPNLLKIGVLLCVMAVASAVSAQDRVPRKIDEFGKWNSEEIEARLDYASIEPQKEPTASLQFLLSRGETQNPGTAFREFGLIRAYLRLRNVDPSRLTPTYCRPAEKEGTEIWLIPPAGTRVSCEADSVDISTTALFDSAFYPNYDFGTCCIVDNLGIAATLESIRGFADLLQKFPDAKGHVFVYGGTNVYWTTDSSGRERTIRHLDTRKQIRNMSIAALRILRQKGVPRSRIVLRESGYRDSPANIETWIATRGGKVPTPTPNYARKILSGKRSNLSQRPRPYHSLCRKRRNVNLHAA